APPHRPGTTTRGRPGPDGPGGGSAPGARPPQGRAPLPRTLGPKDHRPRRRCAYAGRPAEAFLTTEVTTEGPAVFTNLWKWFRRFFNRKRMPVRNRDTGRQRKQALQFEMLETRLVPSISSLLPRPLTGAENIALVSADTGTASNPAAASTPLGDLQAGSTALTGTSTETGDGQYNLTVDITGTAGDGNAFHFTTSGVVTFQLDQSASQSNSVWSPTGASLTQGGVVSFTYEETDANGNVLSSTSGSDSLALSEAFSQPDSHWFF